ncbi:phosphate ABC transporter substrate-binding protein PstS [Microbulbifer sp. A4B17]|uniref:phosphate ABC transporter substrate-binding protein PstS n=1 Tax=Microbulbifer sp. A4B17 TaxID=359370 RepID=UPI000D52ADB3|nr:phosphate ABC transporter substrate-binding protein PstS [Microbulbifer sp. A4B17]AWF82808.1 phosphate ABC transporter substrate-binding protein PstS [Microbulbifer sp. A4B17]
MISRCATLLRRLTAVLATASFILAATSGTAQVPENPVNLRGSGASFPYPIYVEWFRQFTHRENNIFIFYEMSSSGDGIRDFLGHTVDFAASDAAIEIDELRDLKEGGVVLPVTAGEVVLVFNLPGINNLKLSREAYAGIFLGEITHWDDPKIAATNSEIKLPRDEITVVTRSEGSGTSYIFSGHLSSFSQAFRDKIGLARTPNWPKIPRFKKAPGNQGVAAKVRKVPGAIGYVEHGFAQLVNLPVALLENHAGNYIEAGPKSGAEALSEVVFPKEALPVSGAPNLIAWVWDPKGETAYPITSFSWLLLYANQDDEKAKALRQMLVFMLSRNSQSQAGTLGLVPLPENIRLKVLNAVTYVR